MSKKNGLVRPSLVVFLSSRGSYADRGLEVTLTILAAEALSGLDRTTEALKAPGERRNTPKDTPVLAIGLGGKDGVDFTREGGRIVPGSLLQALASREGTSTAEHDVLQELAKFVASYEDGTVPADLGLAGLVGSYYNVVQNNWPRQYTRQMRGAFRNWWDRKVRELRARLEADEIVAAWDKAGEGIGAVVGGNVSLSTLQLLFHTHGLDFVVIRDTEAETLREVLWAPDSRVAALVDATCTELIGLAGDGEYVKWDVGAVPKLGLRNRYLLEERDTEIGGMEAFTAIMAKIKAVASPLPVPQVATEG